MSASFAIRLCVLVALGMTYTVEARAAHVRFETERGPVHVWTPPSYEPETAGIVVYVHGYFTDVDRAWKQHRLAHQFARSGLNALFIACEAPIGMHDAVKWPRLGALLDAVTSEIGALPGGRVIAVGHSGAHRTLSAWLEEDRIDTIVLVDALYGDMPLLREWLGADPEHRLINAAVLTRRWTEALHAELPETLVFERFPPAKAGILHGARDARVVYVRSQHDHMQLVTGGVALPMLLRALQLPIVEDASRKAPNRAL